MYFPRIKGSALMAVPLLVLCAAAVTYLPGSTQQIAVPNLPPGTLPPVALPIDPTNTAIVVDELAPPKPRDAKLKELLGERLRTTREFARQVALKYQAGVGTMEQLLDATRMLFEAELEVCQSDAERVAVLRKFAAEAKKNEDLATARVKAGQVGESTALKAKADRLGVEIALERAKTKVAVKPAQADKFQQGPLYRGQPASFWLEQFKDADPKFRAEAVEALGAFAQKNRELVPLLVAALKDNGASVGTKQVKSVAVGKKAANALAALGPEVVPALMEVLQDRTSPSAACRAAEALGRIGPEAKAAVPLLSQALKTDNMAVWRSAVTALGQIGPEAKPAIPAVIDVLGDFLKSAKIAAKQGKTKSEAFEGPSSFPEFLGEALAKIDPDIQAILPTRDYSASSPQAYEQETLLRWQQAHDALKRKYQARK